MFSCKFTIFVILQYFVEHLELAVTDLFFLAFSLGMFLLDHLYKQYFFLITKSAN